MIKLWDASLGSAKTVLLDIPSETLDDTGMVTRLAVGNIEISIPPEEMHLSGPRKHLMNSDVSMEVLVLKMRIEIRYR